MTQIAISISEDITADELEALISDAHSAMLDAWKAQSQVTEEDGCSHEAATAAIEQAKDAQAFYYGLCDLRNRRIYAAAKKQQHQVEADYQKMILDFGEDHTGEVSEEMDLVNSGAFFA